MVPLFRSRPTVRLRTPRDVVPGVVAELVVLLEADEAVDLEWCDVRVTGTWRGPSGARGDLLRPLEARVCGPRVLPAGTTELPCRFTLPRDAPRSHHGPGTRLEYEVAVHASIPWWPDARARFALHVVAPPGEVPVGRPRVGVSSMEGPRTGVPYGELSIGTDVFEGGAVIDGTVDLRGVDVRQVRVSLVMKEAFGHGTGTPVSAWSIPLAAPGRFAMAVPSEATPTSIHADLSRSYELTLETRGFGGPQRLAALPIVIVDPGRAGGGLRVLPPHVGEERLAQLFARAGEAEGARVEAGPSLVVERAGVVARVTRALGPEGTRLAVHVVYPSLHLDLEVNEPRVVAFARGTDAAREAGLGKRRTLVARDAAQAVALARRLAEPLKRASGLSMTDTDLRYSIQTPANDVATVRRVVRDAARVADALRDPPMPTVLAPGHARWLALATALGGVLEAGHARVIAAREDAGIVVATTFGRDGAPLGTLIRVHPARTLALDAPLWLDGPLPPKLRVPPDARGALSRLARFGHVRVDQAEIDVSLDHPLGLAVPPSRASEVVDAAMRVVVALRPSSGPFR